MNHDAVGLPERSVVRQNLLKALRSLGGAGEAQVVIDKVARMLNVPDQVRRVTYQTGGRKVPAFTQLVRMAREDLKGDGLIAPSRPGVWVLQEAPDLPEVVPSDDARSGPSIQGCANLFRSLGLIVRSPSKSGFSFHSPLPAVPFEGEVEVAGSRIFLMVSKPKKSKPVTCQWGFLEELGSRVEDVTPSLDSVRASLVEGTLPEEAFGGEVVAKLIEGIDAHSRVLAESGDHPRIHVEGLYWYLTGAGHLDRAFSKQELRDALAFLSSPAVGALQESGDGYIQVMTREGISRRLKRLSTAISE